MSAATVIPNQIPSVCSRVTMNAAAVHALMSLRRSRGGQTQKRGGVPFGCRRVLLRQVEVRHAALVIGRGKRRHHEHAGIVAMPLRDPCRVRSLADAVEAGAANRGVMDRRSMCLYPRCTHGARGG
jgi:hypothetical protein